MLDKKEVKTYIVRLYCNNCEREMESTGAASLSSPIQFHYECPNCGWKTTETELYPKVEYQEIAYEKDNVQ